MVENGIRTLEHGLQDLPEEITTSMTIPLAYWKSEAFGSVMFLGYESEPEGKSNLVTWYAGYVRGPKGWTRHLPWYGTRMWFGAEGPPGSADGLEGKAIRRAFSSSGGEPSESAPALVVGGWHSGEVATITLVQGEESTGQFATGHFGAWVVHSENPEAWKVEARDRLGRLIGAVDASPTSG
jgi:hypothetical protein